MKKKLLLISVAIIAAFTLSSCHNAGPGQKRGAATGALLGGATGAVIGNQSDRPLEGAAIGAVAGALLGGSYGSANDDVRRERRGYRDDRRRYDDDDDYRYRRGGYVDPEAEYEEGYDAGRRDARYY